MHPRKLTTENWNTRTPLEKDKYHERSTRPNHQFLIIVGFQNLVFRYIPYITVVKKTTHRLGTHHLLCFDLSCAKRLQWHNYILSSTTNLCAWWEGLIKRVEWCGMWLNISRMSRINGYTMISEKSPFDVRIMPFFSQNWWKWQFWNMTRYILLVVPALGVLLCPECKYNQDAREDGRKRWSQEHKYTKVQI